MPADDDQQRKMSTDSTTSTEDNKGACTQTTPGLVSGEWLCRELRCRQPRHLLVLDCRSVTDYAESHIRGSVALAIPSIMLRRLAAGKVELLSTIKCHELRSRVELLLGKAGGGEQQQQEEEGNRRGSFVLVGDSTEPAGHQGETIHMLARRIRSCGGAVATLEGGFCAFRDRYPEWCEGSNHPGNNGGGGNGCTDSGGGGPQHGDTNEGELMGLRSLRISTPPTRAYSDSDSDSTCDSIDVSARSNEKANERVVRQRGGRMTNGRRVTRAGISGPDEDKDFPVEILPHLYLGNAANSEDSESLARHRIQYILNVTPDLPNVFESDGSIKYMQIPISDHWSQNLASFFPQAIQFIEEARNSDKGVLVHCLAGISRSVTITVAYLMHKCSLNLNDAFNLVRSRKSNIAPNFHFMEQLLSFERELTAHRERNAGSSGSGKPPNSAEQRCIGACRPGGPCTCPPQVATTTSFLSPLDLGLSPDSGIEFDRWAAGTPAE